MTTTFFSEQWVGGIRKTHILHIFLKLNNCSTTVENCRAVEAVSQVIASMFHKVKYKGEERSLAHDFSWLNSLTVCWNRTAGNGDQFYQKYYSFHGNTLQFTTHWCFSLFILLSQVKNSLKMQLQSVTDKSCWSGLKNCYLLIKILIFFLVICILLWISEGLMIIRNIIYLELQESHTPSWPPDAHSEVLSSPCSKS